MKRAAALIIVFALFLTLFSCGKKDEAKYHVVTTVFPAYDLARAVAAGRDDVKVEMLLPAGSESHDFEPSALDIEKIGEADLFITVGGDTDRWVDGVLEAIGHEVPTLRLTDLVELLSEEELEGMEEEHHEHGHEEEEEADEHVWTTPANAAILTRGICSEMCRAIPEAAEDFRLSAEKTEAEFASLAEEYARLSENKERNVLIFADRFPFRYLAHEMGLECYAAFSGCSSDSEPALSTIFFLTEKAKEKDVGAVLTIEFSTSRACETISREAGVPVMELHSCHNVSRSDFDAGVTCLELMKRNLEVLKVALGDKNG